jgi:hypothetical protein
MNKPRINLDQSIEPPIEKLSSSKSTCSDSKMSIKLASCPGEKDIAKFPEFANPFQSMKPRKKPKKRADYKSYNPCEQIIEVQDDGDEMDGAPRRTRWFHPKMLFDGEDELLGIFSPQKSY